MFITTTVNLSTRTGYNSNLLAAGGSVDLNGVDQHYERLYTTDYSSDRFIIGGWFQRHEIDTVTPLFSMNDAGGNANIIRFNANNTLSVVVNSKVNTSYYQFSDVFWYHIVISVDTQASGLNSLLLYVNGEQQAMSATDTITVADKWFNTTQKMFIGKDSASVYGKFAMSQVFGLPNASIQNSNYEIGDFGENYIVGAAGIKTEWTPVTNSAINSVASSVTGSFALTSSIFNGTDSSGNGNRFTIVK